MFVHTLSPDERDALVDALRSPNAFALRRAQVLLASANGQRASQIAATYGCSDQAVRNIIRDYEARAQSALTPRSKARKDQQPIFDANKLEALRAMLHHSPRDFNKESGLWSLQLTATAAHEQRLTPYVVSIETVHNTLKRLSVSWRRAKHWITSPDPAYEHKKTITAAYRDSCEEGVGCWLPGRNVVEPIEAAQLA